MLGSDSQHADIAIWPWVNNPTGFYGAGELVGFAESRQREGVDRLARPAVQRR